MIKGDLRVALLLPRPLVPTNLYRSSFTDDDDSRDLVLVNALAALYCALQQNSLCNATKALRPVLGSDTQETSHPQSS